MNRMSHNSNESELITQRKQDHIQAVLDDPKIERQQSGFEQIQLIHRALPELDYDKVDTSCEWLGYSMSFPLLISSMTGGGATNLEEINIHLAEAAQACQVPMAVGSQRTMLKNPNAAKSFKLRQFAPNIPLIANIGAVQLNYGVSIEQIQRIIDTLQADALYLHLNPLQEVIQPEGDRNFSQLLDKISNLVKTLNIPVILKEVGSGMSAQDIQHGIQAGIQWFDLAGRGGTSWSRIEAHRSDNDLGVLFQDWGLTTVQALQISQAYQSQANFIASGGIRNGVEMVKAVIMGAQFCGVAAPLLGPASESTQATIDKILQLKQEFTTAQFLLGQANLQGLRRNQDLILTDF